MSLSQPNRDIDGGQMGVAREIFAADIAAPFSPSRFLIGGRLPLSTGRLPGGALAERRPCCLDMLVKLPGGPVVLPQAYSADPALRSFLDQALAFEDLSLPGWRDSRYLYLTVDNRFVEAGKTHRNRGWHIDGFQGARYPVKLDACHQFVVADRMTTEFSDASTDPTGLDENHHNWFEELGGQVPADHPIHRAAPLEIVVMSAYQLHRSPIANKSGWRTFIRLDVSLKKQDRLGNSVNPELPAPWTFQPRSLPDGLGRKVSDAGWVGAMKFGAE